MIPSYKEEVKITIIDEKKDLSIDQQIGELKEQIRQLKETVDYLHRDKNRLKSEIDSIKNSLKKN